MAAPGRQIPIPVPVNFGWVDWQLRKAGYALLVDEIASRRAKSISESLKKEVKVTLRGFGGNKGMVVIGSDRIYLTFVDGTYKLTDVGTSDNEVKAAITAAFGEGLTAEEFESVKNAVKAEGIPDGVDLNLAILGTAKKGGYRRSRKHRKSRKASRKGRKTHCRRRA